MLNHKRNITILVVLIVIISLVKLNPFTKSAQMNRDSENGMTGEITNYMSIVPFSTIGEYITNSDQYNNNIIIRFFVINAILYLPIAFLLGLFKISNLPSILIIILLPILLDGLQLIFRIGRFDIDAILVSIICSFVVFIIMRIIMKRKHCTIK